MPKALARACRVMGCPGGADCTHGRKATDKAKPSATSLGYDHRWRKFREWYIGELFRLEVPRAGLCGSRLPSAPATNDSECLKAGDLVVGTVLDHITPVTGPDDPSWYDTAGLQLVCLRCHQKKRNRERRTF